MLEFRVYKTGWAFRLYRFMIRYNKQKHHYIEFTIGIVTGNMQLTGGDVYIKYEGKEK